jgi:hypothetical protein
LAPTISRQRHDEILAGYDGRRRRRASFAKVWSNILIARTTGEVLRRQIGAMPPLPDCDPGIERAG